MAPANSLGPLEADIMQVIWNCRQATVQDVFAELAARRSIAYNTVMTVMTRLAQKGILERRKQGRAYLYSAAATKTEVAESMLQYIIDKLFGGSRVPVLSHLLEGKSLSEEELDYLTKLVRTSRKENKVRSVPG